MIESRIQALKKHVPTLELRPIVQNIAEEIRIEVNDSHTRQTGYVVYRPNEILQSRPE